MGVVRRGVLLVAVLAGLPAARGAGAAAGAPDAPPPSTAFFARVAPDTTGIYFEVRNLGRLDAAITRAHAWNLLPMFETETGATRSRFVLRSAVALLLRIPTADVLDAVMDRRVALAATSWSTLEDAVFFVQLGRGNTLNAWFPPARRHHAVQRGGVLSFGTDVGLDVVVRGDMLAVSRAGSRDGLFSRVSALMRREPGRSMGDDPDGARLLGALPPGLLGMAAITATPDGPSAHGVRWPVPNVRRVVAGLFERAGTLELEVRTESITARAPGALGAFVADAVERLPDDVLLGWASLVDWSGRFDALIALGDDGAGPVRNLMGEWFQPAEFRSRVLDQLGPRSVIAWTENPGARGGIPHVALMAELRNAATSGRSLETYWIQTFKGKTLAHPGGGRGTASLTRRTHLGTRIFVVALAEPPAPADAASGALLEAVRPSLAIVDGWVIIAPSPEPIERIIDARRGLVPTLGQVDDLRRRLPSIRSDAMAGIAQPALAAAVMRGWPADGRGGIAALIGSSAVETPPSRRGIGIAVQVRNPPGMVEVDRVYPDTAAEGLVRVGDRIVGVDGVLLSLVNTNADLRARLTQSGSIGGPVLRVLRDGGLVDVPLPTGGGVERIGQRDMAGAIRELTALGDRFEFASWSVSRIDEHHDVAHLVLRYRRPATQ